MPDTANETGPASEPSSSTEPLDRYDLREYGFGPFFQAQLEALPEDQRDGTTIGRVVLELRGVLRVLTHDGLVEARVPGRMHHESVTGGELPTVGDWVLVQPPARPGEDGWIERVLERRSKFSRQAAGARTREQVVAANIDVCFVMMGVDGDFQPRRLERYLASIREGGADVVLLLNKIDLADDPEALIDQVRDAAADSPVLLISAKHGEGMGQLSAYLRSGSTIALVGSSGVGKSTLLNTLLGEQAMRVGAVRSSDDRGQHTTSHREMLRLPSGALLIDNPGIRELQPWDAEDGLEEAFPEIVELETLCRFADCQHESEPQCAVRDALERGEISKARLRSYRKLRAEQEARSERKQQYLRSKEKQFTKTVHKAMRDKNRSRYR